MKLQCPTRSLYSQRPLRHRTGIWFCPLPMNAQYHWAPRFIPYLKPRVWKWAGLTHVFHINFGGTNTSQLSWALLPVNFKAWENAILCPHWECSFLARHLGLPVHWVPRAVFYLCPHAPHTLPSAELSSVAVSESGKREELFNFNMWISNFVVLCYELLEGMHLCQVFPSSNKTSLDWCCFV